MAPGVTGKRRRPEQGDSTDDPDTPGSRPSPHHPQDLPSARRSEQLSVSQAESPSRFHTPTSSSRAPQRGRGGRPVQTSGRGRGNNSNAGSPRGEAASLSQAPAPSEDPGKASSQGLAQTKSHLQSTPPSASSQPPAQPSSQHAVTPSPSAPPGPPPPFYFEILTDDYLAKMQETGPLALQEASVKAYEMDDAVALSELFQEVLRSGLDKRLDAAQAGTMLSRMIESAPPNSSVEAAPLLMDTLSILPERDISNPLLKTMMQASGISPELMRLTLEDGLLRALGLTRDTFGRMFVRKQTHILYRQSNYNLLREETEGYSKLLTELFTVPQPDVLPAGVVEQTLENIKALIGAFDLDAGRVLDVTLDVFANMLVKKYRFFVKFLRASPFWPQAQLQDQASMLEADAMSSLPLWALPDHPEWETSEGEASHQKDLRQQRDLAFWQEARASGLGAFFALGGRKLLNDAQKSSEVSTASQDDRISRGVETTRWIEKTGTLPPQGNSVAAQLLGFKLRFYASPARDKDDKSPPNLVYLAALLIKIGFISLRDLYTHIYPEDDDMAVVKEKQSKENEERERARRPGGGTMNALARAGALSDDGPSALPTSRLRGPDTRASTPGRTDAPETRSGAQQGKIDEAFDPLPEPTDQKVELLKSLLLLGALPESLYMIGRFPWLMDAFPDLPAYVNRILHHCISQVYEGLRPMRDRDTAAEAAQPPAMNQSGLPRGELRLADAPKPKPRRWAQIDKYDADNYEGGDMLFRFYWDDWSNDVPVCQTVDDIFTLCNTLLNLSGVKIGRDLLLLAKLARIGKQSLTADRSDSNQTRWVDLLKRLLCPALSMTDANPGIVLEIYDLLKMFPTQTRYAIYAEWFQGQISRTPDVSNAFTLTRARTKDILKRINKQNTRSMARQLSKVSFSSPGVVFEVCLNQIESYENLIDVVIECARYFSFLSYDVLTWAIMSFLGREGRSRVSQTGFTANKWLQALSTFTGQIYKRYALMNPLPILRYVFDQIRQNNYTDLRILRDLISSMAGIAADTDFSESQVLAMAGGELLRSLTLRQLSDKRHECKVSAKRLLRTIVDNNLAGPILIAVAQQRQTCVFSHEQDDTKILGETFDEVVVVLTQYLDMLTEHLGPKEFTALIPSVATLISEFGLEPSMAFTIHRKSISQQMADYDLEHKPTPKSARPSDNSANAPDLDVKMTDAGEKAVVENSAGNVAETAESTAAGEIASDAEELGNGQKISKSPPAPAVPGTSLIWHPVLEELVGELEPMLSEETRSHTSISFFATFWQLGLSDIMAPSMSYDEEINRQRNRLAAINADRSDMSPAGLRKKDAEKKAINDTLESLREEMKAHVRGYQTVRARLLREKGHWFKDFESKTDDLHMGLLQECFLPRLLISPIDAQYAQKMLFFLHSVGATNFRTGRIISRLLNTKTLTNLIFQATRREADNLGRFLFEVLKVLSEWHADRAEFEKKAHGPRKDLPGFASKFNAEGKPEAFLDFQEFRRILRHWHQHVFSALKNCLASPEYMHARNAIQILNRIVKIFPVIEYMGTSLTKELKSLEEREKSSQGSERQDLTTAARSLFGQLKPREKHWMILQDFCVTETSSNKPETAAKGTESTSEVNASRPAESKQTNVNAIPAKLDGEVSQSVQADKADTEDGELPDGHGRTEPEPKSGQIRNGHAADEGRSQKLDSVNGKPTSSNKHGSDPGRLDASQLAPSRSGQELHGPTESHKRKSGETGQDADKQSGGEPNKRARINEAGHASRAEAFQTQPPDRRPYQRRGAGEQDDVLPPPMPRSERPPHRSLDPPRGPPKHRDLSYGRLNAEQDTVGGLAPGRLSRPDYPPVADRRSSNSTSSGQAPPDGRGPPAFSERPTRTPEARRGGTASTPSSTGPEAVGVHPSRLMHIEGPAPHPPPVHASRSPPPPPRQRNPMQPPQATSPATSRPGPLRGAEYPGPGTTSPTISREPPSGPAGAPAAGNFGRNDNRRQFAKVQETLRQGGQPSPSGPRSAGQYPSGPAYDRQTEQQYTHHNERESGPALNRDARGGRQGGSRPGTSYSDPQEALPVNPQRAALIDQDGGPLPAPRGQREEGRYAQEPSRPYPPRHPSPGRNVPASERGTSIRGRASNPQMDGRSSSGAIPAAERLSAPRGPASHHASERRDGSDYGGSFPPQYRSHRDDRADLASRDPGTVRRERGPDDQSLMQRTSSGMDGRQRHYEREPARDARDGTADRPADKDDFPTRPPRAAYENSHLRGSERPLRRGMDKDLMRDHPSEALQDRVTPRDAGMRDRRGEDRSGYGRDDAMAPYQEHRGPPPPRRGGWQTGPEGRAMGDVRGEARRGDFSRDRREPMNGGGIERRTRDWNEESGQGDSKRPPPRRSMN